MVSTSPKPGDRGGFDSRSSTFCPIQLTHVFSDQGLNQLLLNDLTGVSFICGRGVVVITSP
jgi:hypothetical protein